MDWDGNEGVAGAIDRLAEEYWKLCAFMASGSDGLALFRSIDDIAAWLARRAGG